MGNYEERANSLDIWLYRSEELSLAAKATWVRFIVKNPEGTTDKDHVHLLYRPAVLLMGLSLEVLLKGFIISDRSHIQGGKFPEKLKTHSLTELFEMTEIELEEIERSALIRWTENVVWVSKYAVPLKESELRTDAFGRFNFDFEIFEKLRQKVFTHFDFDSTKISRHYF